MSYLIYSFNLTENQKMKLANAYNIKKAVNIKLKNNQLTGDFPIMITLLGYLRLLIIMYINKMIKILVHC